MHERNQRLLQMLAGLCEDADCGIVGLHAGDTQLAQRCLAAIADTCRRALSGAYGTLDADYH